MNRIDRAFRRARRKSRAVFIPFLTAGDPDLETTAALVEEAGRRGADVVELGIPFSDPVADGGGGKGPRIFLLRSGGEGRCTGGHGAEGA